MVMGFPPTTPPALRRQGPLDLSQLPPEIQQQLAAGQPVTGEDGSIIYPDGTFTGAGDSPDDFEAGAFDFGPGGFNASPHITGGPPTAPPPGGMGGEMGMAPPPTSPFDGPQFDRYLATANAPFPGTPGGLGGPPPETSNPMGDPVGDAADAEPNVRLSVEGPTVGTFGANGPGEAGAARVPALPGRIGRRMSQRQARPGSRPMSARRRR